MLKTKAEEENLKDKRWKEEKKSSETKSLREMRTVFFAVLLFNSILQ